MTAPHCAPGTKFCEACMKAHLDRGLTPRPTWATADEADATWWRPLTRRAFPSWRAWFDEFGNYAGNRGGALTTAEPVVERTTINMQPYTGGGGSLL